MWDSCQAGFSDISSSSFNDLGQFFSQKAGQATVCQQFFAVLKGRVVTGFVIGVANPLKRFGAIGACLN